ncbi:MAG TPA: valine--tRNA ligase [Kofleriaceae bacterium]|nr:valine--tRNA ligase [Kofleriaceae bacterium]
MASSLPKQYDPTDVESRWLRFWQGHDFFHAEASAAKAPYAVTLPPPNVTGSLHIGHALGGTIQDVLVRWRRMQGFNAMWMPGLDHAGIATQMLVERDLQRTEGKSRHDVGRDEFVRRVWAWKEKFGGRILEQLKLLGFSLDWERERFTMDEPSSRAVREAFVKLYEDGLIYRAQRLVNWCVDCYTAVSDLEVNNEDESGHLWELRYPLATPVGGRDSLTVATTRPETMLGDTGVAVHPGDERYKDLIGTMVKLPLTDREIPIVGDEFVDPEFGSGAVKVTPGHDFNDFECGQRCNLEVLSIIDPKGTIIAPAPENYRGLTVAQARVAVVADLDAAGLLVSTKDYSVPRGRCDRSNTIIEPLLSQQWFVKAGVLAEPAIAAVETGKTTFVPELWTKTYMHWMKNIKDWCVSRQLWWGHRIPAWYCDACDAITVSRQDPTACNGCGAASLRQDDDVLDTWFSSALWPFSTLGWPDPDRSKASGLRTFYPNTVLVTAADIIFFWVARMMMMGLHFQGKVPFRTVYFTPIVTDEKGDKMSKVKGNVVDPLDIIHGATAQALVERAEADGVAEQAIANVKKAFPKGIAPAGADALRFTLAAMTLPGRNIRLSTERIEGYRNFVNKLWNASRFAMMHLESFAPERFEKMIADGPPRGDSGLALEDRWILSRLQRIMREVDEALEAFRFADAANGLYHFVWGELCDWYIELAKPSLYAGAEAADGPAADRRLITQGTLATVLELTLRLLHPFMPFVTEEIWHKLPKPSALPSSLMITIYPQGDPRFVDEEAEREMGLLQEITVAIRMLRSTYHVPPSWSVPVEVRIPSAADRDVVERYRSLIENTARVTLSVVEAGEVVPQSATSIVRSDIEVVVPLAGLVDIDEERGRIAKDIKKTQKDIDFVSKKLGNPSFLERAPDDIIEKERAKLEEAELRKRHLTEALATLG